LASLPVLYNVDGHDIPGIGEKGFEFGFTGLQWKVSYIYFLIYSSLPMHFSPRFNDIFIFWSIPGTKIFYPLVGGLGFF
jgi:hypothetical protein